MGEEGGGDVVYDGSELCGENVPGLEGTIFQQRSQNDGEVPGWQTQRSISTTLSLMTNGELK